MIVILHFLQKLIINGVLNIFCKLCYFYMNGRIFENLAVSEIDKRFSYMDLQKLSRLAEDTWLEFAVLSGLFYELCRSEIAGLKWRNIKGVVKIN